MGTNGQKVYRYKGHYYVYYNQLDSYPTHFGLTVLREIHRGASKEEFEKWVRLTQEKLDAHHEELKNSNSVDYLTEKQPKNTLCIEWIYEIDLDHLVFHVDTQPLFRLDNMLPEDVFLKSISFDHFGHRALHKLTPVEFRYNWHAPPPAPRSSSSIVYNSCRNLSTTSPVHELLRVPTELSSIERARTTLVEVLVTKCMIEYGVGHGVRVLESVPDRDHISQSMLEFALSLVNFAVGPPIPSLPCTPRGDPRDFIWIRKDVCLRITMHLDDEGNLQASIGDLVHHINTTQDKVGTVYGVACSIFHCAVVRVDKKGQDTTFAHTPALKLLPSFYATKIFTPGIESLSRLGCQSNGVEFLGAISEAYNFPSITHGELLGARSLAAKIPVEVWMNVGHFITSPMDLVNLASISPRAMSAAADLARYPWVLEFRLVDVVGSISPVPETTENTEENDIRKCYLRLGSAKFIAVKGGRLVNLDLKQVYHRKLGVQVPFKFRTFMRDPVIITRDNLFVSEPDEDKAN